MIIANTNSVNIARTTQLHQIRQQSITKKAGRGDCPLKPEGNKAYRRPIIFKSQLDEPLPQRPGTSCKAHVEQGEGEEVQAD